MTHFQGFEITLEKKQTYCASFWFGIVEGVRITPPLPTELQAFTHAARSISNGSYIKLIQYRLHQNYHQAQTANIFTKRDIISSIKTDVRILIKYSKATNTPFPQLINW